MKLIATNCALLVVVSVSAIMQVVTGGAAPPSPAKGVGKKVVFEKVTFDADPDWVLVEKQITKVGDETAINVQTSIKKAIPDDSLVSIDVSSERNNNEFGAVIQSGKISVCDLFNNATSQPMVNMVLTALQKFTNLPLKCPLPAGEYFVKELIVDSALIPDFLPEGRFKVDVAIFHPDPKAKTIYQTEWIFSLTKRE